MCALFGWRRIQQWHPSALLLLNGLLWLHMLWRACHASIPLRANHSRGTFLYTISTAKMEAQQGTFAVKVRMGVQQECNCVHEVVISACKQQHAAFDSMQPPDDEHHYDWGFCRWALPRCSRVA